MCADIRPRIEHLLAQDELFSDICQILVEPNDSEREFVGFLKHDVFTHGLPSGHLWMLADACGATEHADES
jgi:hypothetical protein